MKKVIFTLIILCGVVLAGCGDADMQGIVLDVSEKEIKLAEDLPLKEYEKIKNESVKKLQKEDVEGTRESLHLIDITYDHANDFSKGDEVEVWIDGDIMTSYPGQANAKKVSIKK